MASGQTLVDVFLTDLGWILTAGDGRYVQDIKFGHESAGDVLEAWKRGATCREFQVDSWNPSLRENLQRYAAGELVDFDDVEIAPSQVSAFATRVLTTCRSIPRGETMTYGQLARLAGSPGAARAVGNVMANNRLPLVIPCHRVVPAGRRLGGFSAPSGPTMKARLLKIENADPAVYSARVAQELCC